VCRERRNDRSKKSVWLLWGSPRREERKAVQRYCQMLWVKKLEHFLAHPFSGGYQNTNPFEIVDCRPATEAVFSPSPSHDRFFEKAPSYQAAS
jgi:hypothetical protein